jgi:DHA1 family multidrug resistance protein-like MFS transporter
MRLRAWLVRWRPVLPILVAEFVAMVGFGAMLPVLPLYVVEQHVDDVTLGIIVAAWPAARLVAEPFFGWLADRTSRRPLMLAGMLVMAAALLLPLVFRSALELVVLRLLGGLGAGMYDPAARGYLVDATQEGERGQVFGLYQGASMGGIVAGPAIAALGAAAWSGYTFPFAFAAVMCVLAAIYLAVALMPISVRAGEPSGMARVPIGQVSLAGYGADGSVMAEPEAAELELDRRPLPPLRTLVNRFVVAALVMNFGLYLAVGVYDVVWSLYMRGLGASVSWIGVSFALFGLPILLLAPIAGGIVDRIGGLRFAVVGGLGIALAGYVYTLAQDPVFPVVVGLFEATAVAFLGPALFAILATGSPRGRSSTTQGVFGSAGTLAFITGALVAGRLLAVDLHYPFYFFAVVASLCFAAGWLILRGAAPSRASETLPGPQAV